MASPGKRAMRKLRSVLAQAVELEVCTHAHADAVWREAASGSDNAERAAEVWLEAVSRARTAQPQTRHTPSPKRLSTSPSVRSLRQYSPEVRRRTPSPRRTAAGPRVRSPRQYAVARRESQAKQYSPEVRHRLVARRDPPATQRSPRKPSDGIVGTTPSQTHVELGHRAVLKDHRDVMTPSFTTVSTGSPSSPAYSLERNKHIFPLSPSWPNLPLGTAVVAVSDQESGNTSSRQTDARITAGNGVDGPAEARRGKFAMERHSRPVIGAGVSAPRRRCAQPTRTVRETEVATGHPSALLLSQQTQRHLPKHCQQHQYQQQHQHKSGGKSAENTALVEPELWLLERTTSPLKPTPMTLAVAADHVRYELGLSGLPLVALINAGRLELGMSPVDKTTPLKQGMAQLCDRLGIQTYWEQKVHNVSPRPSISEDAVGKAADATKKAEEEAAAKQAAVAAAAEQAAEEARAATQAEEEEAATYAKPQPQPEPEQKPQLQAERKSEQTSLQTQQKQTQKQTRKQKLKHKAEPESQGMSEALATHKYAPAAKQFPPEMLQELAKQLVAEDKPQLKSKQRREPIPEPEPVIQSELVS